MWVIKNLISTVKKGFFAQKQPNLAQNWHFWSIWARPCHAMRAGCISQDTYLLYCSYHNQDNRIIMSAETLRSE